MSKEIQPTSHKPRIAIAGGTGRVGSTLTSLLASDPVDITVLTRRPDAAQLPKGVSIAAIDFGQPHTLQEALRGAIGCSFRMARRHCKWPTRSR